MAGPWFTLPPYTTHQIYHQTCVRQTIGCAGPIAHWSGTTVSMLCGAVGLIIQVYYILSFVK